MKTGGRLIKHARYYWLLLAESSDAAALWEHAAQGRDAGVASRIGGPRSAADFGDEIGGGRSVSDNSVGKVRVSGFMPMPSRIGPLPRRGKFLDWKSGQEIRVCKLPGARARLNRNFKVEIPVKDHKTRGVATPLSDKCLAFLTKLS